MLSKTILRPLLEAALDEARVARLTEAEMGRLLGRTVTALGNASLAEAQRAIDHWARQATSAAKGTWRPAAPTSDELQTSLRIIRERDAHPRELPARGPVGADFRAAHIDFREWLKDDSADGDRPPPVTRHNHRNNAYGACDETCPRWRERKAREALINDKLAKLPLPRPQLTPCICFEGRIGVDPESGARWNGTESPVGYRWSPCPRCQPEAARAEELANSPEIAPSTPAAPIKEF